MTNQTRTVTVKQLPEKLSVRQRWIFFREIESYMNADRPRLVLDCSSLHQVNRAVIHLILRCLEDAMKRNGDVKLAAIPREVKTALERTGVNRLFEIFDTTEEAVKSFHLAPV
jgi:anti-anti-sigma factor